ncbi:MAG TPA: phage holin family protein [Pirellula sp.]|nr:phage holin family protein [Pirellula sp.]
MVDIEKISEKYEHAGPVTQFTESAGRFACDLLELTELQASLFKADAQSVFKESINAIATVAIGCSLLLGTIPVVVFGLASATAFYWQIDVWIAQLAVGGGLTLLSLMFIAGSFKTLSKSTKRFKRSTAEFSKNMEWTKDVIRSVSSK